MWTEVDHALYKKFLFANFSEAFAFMTRVALLAESEQHHPRWMNEWNQVAIWLQTHDAGNIITEKDRSMARKIDQLLPKDSGS